MERHPDFQHDNGTPSLEHVRRMANKRAQIIWQEKFYSLEDVSFKQNSL